MQHVILYVLVLSYIDDGKSWNESSKIGVMNQSYSWRRRTGIKQEIIPCSPGPRVTVILDSDF